MLISLDYLRINVPGFENCYIVDTCSQIGTRGSRRLKGEHTLTWEEVTSGVIHEDAIVISSQSWSDDLPGAPAGIHTLPLSGATEDR